MFDAHVHLQDPRLGHILGEVIQAAAKSGVTALCCCATAPDDWEPVQILAEAELPFALVPAFGVHPWHVQNLPPDWRETLIARLEHIPIAAVGEIGMDGLRREISPEVQERVFVAQLDIAIQMARPVVLHGARAWGRLLDLLRPRVKSLPGFILHSFSGSAEILRQALDLGGYLSFAGTVCNPKATKVRTAASLTPESAILIESDTPDIFPTGGIAAGSDQAGRPLNQPANLVNVLNEVATLRGITPEHLADVTAVNACRILL